jgi:hypothetical protein
MEIFKKVFPLDIPPNYVTKKRARKKRGKSIQDLK